ncbi:MAG: ABC transporter substrate-binding protein [Alphaproteobacteria bacterium]|nr:ABC transporter substrate-binding protein [Alphaproteobacteria bacterium]
MIVRRSILAGAAALAAAIPSRAQQPRLPRIGFLILDNPSGIRDRLLEALRERGLVDGRTVVVEYRSAEGVVARLDELAAELVRLPVDLIIANQTPAATAAKRATSRIPIVMSAGDPVGTGLVASLARPGGNVTGFASIAAEVVGKGIELLREISPGLNRVGALINGNDPFGVPLLEQARRAATEAKLAFHPVIISNPAEIETGIAALAGAKVDAVMVQPSLPHARVLELARHHRLPTFATTRAFAEAGGLFTYASSIAETWSQVSLYAERILKGARPEDLPVMQPTRFELVINLATARALDITIPQAIIDRADEVIE